jgi:hypothetical protein
MGRIGLPRYDTLARAPRIWQREQRLVDAIVRNYERNDLAIRTAEQLAVLMLGARH